MTPKGKGKDQEPFLKDSTKQTETIPSASSSGSCVMSDIGSVGSNSTKTRFSFYNAQEVAQKKDPSTTTCNEQQQQQQQQQQTQDDSNDTNENKSNKSDNETSFCSNNRFNFYNANEVNGTISISSTRNHNHNNSNTTVPQSTEETVTLASAVAVAAAASRENDKIINKDGAQDKDDRRSPQTPQFHDDDDVTNGTPRIPAANSTTANAATTAAAAYTAAIKSTPQRSNSTCFKTDDGTAVSPSDQAAEQEAVIATDDPVSSIVKRVSDEAPHEYNDDQTSAHVSTTTTDNNDTNMNSVDILRSLQDTEHMRNVTKQCDAMSQEGGVVYRATTASASDEEEESDKETNEHFSNQEDCTSQEDTSQEIYENADTFDSDDVHNLQLRNLQEQVRKLEMVKKSSAERELVTSSKAMPTGTGAGVGTSHHHLSSPGTFQEYHNSLQRPASTIAPPPLPSVAGATTTTTAVEEEANSAAASINPYESAIREALDLLRKHRPPSPYYPPLATQDTGVTSMAVVQEEIDTSTTAHHQHDPEELSARRKERQERMARYSSRLAELKNSGEDGCPVSNNNSNADLATMSSTAAQSETIQRPFVQNLQPDQQSLAGQNDDLSSVPPAHNALPASTCDVPASFYSVDVASIGASSSLSGSHYGVPATTANPKEVHRNVERVLLAILERANSNGRAVQSTSNSATAMDSPATSLHGSIHTTGVSTRSEDSIVYQRVSEEKKSPDPRSNSSGTHPDVAENPLLLAVGELLSAGRVHSVDSRVSGVASPARRSVTTDRSNTTTGTRRSVVEELLAEAESFGTEQQVSTSTMQTGIQTAPAGKQPAVSERHAQGSAKVSKRAAKSDADAHSVVVDKELDELVLKTLGKPNCKRNLSHDNESTESDQEETGEYTEDRESQSRTCTSYDDDDDDLEDNYNGDSQEIDDDDLDDALEGVLGPLSGNAGESTGVVLEANLSPRSNSDGESIFNSLSNAMSSLVASAMSSEEKKSLLAGQFTKCSARDKYATDMDNAENDGNEGSRSGEEDDEANELMRSLCAHLLPFGVDQSTRFLDEVPHWDDENPNEAGYRIIRLTSQQLLRVEHAFESMVSKFKKDSENELIGGGTNANTIDESFERDLAVAEQVLDGDVEADRTSAIMKALKLIPKGPSGKARDATDSGDESDTDTSDHDSVSEQADISHPDFPGIHSAGKGEMGDLEYFSLPIIFKSHVTGFEPTKDLFLEPGNVVAGQYLVESELGSAAFSTAYRCVDLNSEGDDTEDGHQEVCLKVIKNTKDFFDQSLDEIKILELLRQTGKCHVNNIIEMRTFFYHREHLVIVTELLRQNLFEFGKFILDHDEEPYFTLPRLGYITRQCLIALRFVHELGLVHSDIKPENLLLASYSRAKVKVIDFGSSCYLTDRQSSYIQSRSYRAPEVVLGLPYDGKIDVWSLGCVVAEMLTGEVTFQNDSVVSMLSRIEAICGPFPRHMIAQGRQSCRFFTKCGLLFEKVSGDVGPDTPDLIEDDNSQGLEKAVFDIFQPKTTTLSARLGFPSDLHERYASGDTLSPIEQKQGMFIDFVKKTLTIDPDSRPSAAAALKHPWMVYAASLTEEDIKYPSP